MDPSITHPHRFRAAQVLVLCCAFWAFSFPATKALQMLGTRAVPGISTWTLSAWCIAIRFGIGILPLAALVLRSGSRISRLEWIQGLGLGAFCSAGLLFQLDGMAHTSASVSAFLTQAYCVFIPLWLAVVARKLPPSTVWLACLLALAGGAILCDIRPGQLRLGRGEWETLAGSVIFTAQILWIERPVFRGTQPIHFSLVMFLVMAVTQCLVALVSAPDPPTLLRVYAGLPSLLLLLFLTLACTLFTFVMMNRWQREMPATEAGLLYGMEPIFTAIVSLFVPAWLTRHCGVNYPNETPSWNVFLGGGLIVAANVVILWPEIRARR